MIYPQEFVKSKKQQKIQTIFFLTAIMLQLNIEIILRCVMRLCNSKKVLTLS